MLDIDEATSLREILANLAFCGHAAAIASTHSHQQSKPKFRIISPLAEPFRVADYADLQEAAEAWKCICRAFAESLCVKADTKAFLLSQFFYDPRHPREAEPIVRLIEGRAVEVSRLLDWTKVRRDHRRADRSAPERATFQRSIPAVKIFGGDVTVLRRAVMAIGHDERIGMNDWIAIVGAICEETDGSDDGRELAHEWSATWIKGYDEDETEGVWRRALSNLGKGATKASGKTIRLRAANADWEPPPGWKWPDGWNRGITFKDERQQQDIVDRFNEEFAVIKIKGKVRVLTEEQDVNGQKTFDLLPERDFRLLAMNRGFLTTSGAKGGNLKNIPAGDYWLKSPQRREYPGGLVFRPGEEIRPNAGSNASPRFYNIWRGWGIEQSSQGSCRLFEHHLREVICRGDLEHYNWLLDWMAHIFQKPLEKPGVALVLRGKKGTGKSIVGKTLGVLVGPRHYFVLSQQDQLVGKFNAPLASAVLIQAEEAFFVHDPKAWGALKDLITRETRTVEPKGVDAYIVEAFDRLIITSNESAVVPAEAGERRYAVFDVGDSHARDTAHFAAMEKELRDGGYAHLLHKLLSRDLRDFDSRTAPETAALSEQKQHNLNPVAKWMLDRLQDGWFWSVRDNEDRQEEFDDAGGRDAPNRKGEGVSSGTIGKETVRQDCLVYCRSVSHRSRISEAEFGKLLVEHLGFVPAQRRCKADRRDPEGLIVKRKGERERCYRLPSLTDARAKFIQSFELPETIFDEDGSDAE